MNDRERQMIAAVNAVLKAHGGEVRFPATDLKDVGVVAFMPDADAPETMIAKRFDNYEDATAAIEGLRHGI